MLATPSLFSFEKIYKITESKENWSFETRRILDVTWRFPLSTYLVLAFDGVGAPIGYWLVSNVPRPDMNNIVFMWKHRMRIPGTAKGENHIPWHPHLCLVLHETVEMGSKVGGILELERRHEHTKESFASAYRHQSESWSSGRAHWLLSNSAYTGMCESKPRQLEK